MKRYFILYLFFLSLSTYSQVTLTTQTQINYVCNGNPCFYNGPKILINEVMLTPATHDGSTYGTGPGYNPGDNEGEWIELYNPDKCKPVDISCYFLGNNTNEPNQGLYNLGAGFTLPQGTIVPPRGFVLIRGINAPPVPSNLLIANGGRTIEIVVDNNLINNICIGGGYRLWFPNAGGWFAFYDNFGVPQDAISWNSLTNSYTYGNPCNPVSSGCSYTGVLPSYDSIPASRKNYITSLDPASFAGQSWGRIPDGGSWSGSAASPTYGTCNDVCVPPPVITCNGMAVVTASGGAPPYSYIWDDTQATMNDTATGLCAGIYHVTVTDNVSNTATASVQIYNAELSPSISSTDINCFGGSNGSATVTVTNGTPQYTYLWSNSGSTSTINNLSAGNYSVTVTDIYGCDTVIDTTIYEPPQLSSTSNVTPASCFGQSDGSISVTVSGGTPNYSYHWNTTPVQTNSAATNLPAGTYIVTITDANGCTQQSTEAINQPTAISTTFTITTDSCGVGNGSATVNASGGAGSYTYNWSPGGGTNATVTGLSAGIYNLTVTDINGCAVTNSTIVTSSGSITAIAGPNSSICEGQSATITATGGTGFLWNNGETTSSITISPSVTTTYSVVVSTAGCSAAAFAIITVNPLPVIDAGLPQTVCNGSSATLTATGAINYLWNTGETTDSITVSPVSATTYTVNGSDVNGCTGSASVIVNVTQISATADSSGANCGHSDGSVTIIPAGNCSQSWSYLWNSVPAQTDSIATNLPVGTYTVTISCGSCITTASVSVNNLPGPSVAITSITNTICGYANGGASVSINGGTPGFTYLWSNGQSGQNLTDVIAGTYDILVTDTNGCNAYNTVIITDTQGPLAITSSVNEICRHANGSANVTASGGSAPYTYLWSNDSITSTNTGLIAGNYSVTVTDTNGCTISASINVNETQGPDANFSAYPNTLTIMDGPVSFIDNSSGTVTNWQWNFGDGSQNASGQGLNHDYDSVGTYIVTLIVIDSNGCTDTTTGTIIVKDIFTFYVPNAFTPDDDGINDYFFPQGENWDPNHFDMCIFDRWGNLIYHTNIIGERWNGTVNNKGKQDDTFIDVYVYLIRVKDLEGTKHEYIGRVTLVK